MTRQSRQRANDRTLGLGLVITVLLLTLLILAVAGVWVPPGWEAP